MNTNSAVSNGSTDAESAVPEDAGKRIPIPIESPGRKPGTVTDTAVPRSRANSRTRPATQPADNTGPAGPGRMIVPDVMADGRPADTTPAEAAEELTETIEERVSRLRPKSLRMQLRFLHTLVFAIWLFGRLIFWQIYVAKVFPKWVNNRNVQRWKTYARQFRQFAIHMGGVMIKAGQFASTRADVLPPEIIEELVSLQDEVPTVRYRLIESVMKRELGDLSQHFSWINEDPIAAASLGQVHRARLNDADQTAVVIKVQRPGIREVVYTDMSALFIVAHIAMRFGFINRRADMVGLAEEFGRVLLEEISYNKELQNAERFHQIYDADPGVYIPRVYREQSTDYVLTLEDVTYIKINHYEALDAAGIDRKLVARRLMDTYMQQVFEDRFFHADPHPGNLFVRPLPVENDDLSSYQADGSRPFQLVFIDFGMTGSLTREIVQGLINTLTAVITRDAKKLVESYQKLGFLLPGADTKRIEAATRIVFDEVWGLSFQDMSTLDFAVVEEIGKEFNDLLYDLPFRVPQDFIYLGRTVSILSGMATALDPEFNPWSEIQGNIQHLITTDAENNLLDELGALIFEPFSELLAGNLPGFIAGIQQLALRFQRPNRAVEMLQSIIDGDVEIQTRLSPQHRRQLERIEIQGQRTSRTFIFGSLLITSTLFYTTGEITLATIGFGMTGMVFVSLLFIRQ